MRLIGRWPCVRVETIEVFKAADADTLLIIIDGNLLSTDETEAFLFRDGFRTAGFPSHAAEAFDFWKKRLPFRGQVIHWRYSR